MRQSGGLHGAATFEMDSQEAYRTEPLVYGLLLYLFHRFENFGSGATVSFITQKCRDASTLMSTLIKAQEGVRYPKTPRDFRYYTICNTHGEYLEAGASR